MSLVTLPPALASVFVVAPAWPLAHVDTTGDTVAPSGSTYTGEPRAPWILGALNIGSLAVGALSIQAASLRPRRFKKR